jgi:hypothetical protein
LSVTSGLFILTVPKDKEITFEETVSGVNIKTKDWCKDGISGLSIFYNKFLIVLLGISVGALVSYLSIVASNRCVTY